MSLTRLGIGCLWTIVLATGACVVPASADTNLGKKTYYFGTHPARTNITFVSEADLETIHGITHEVSGALRVSADGTSATGTLSVPVASLRTGIELRDTHLRSDQWLDAEHHPWIRLALIRATEARDTKTWDYEAQLTIKGTTRKLKGSARVTAIPDRLGQALGPGSWVRVRTGFEVTLSDFRIQIPSRVGPKVSRRWAITVDVYGTTAPPKGQR